MTAVTDPRELMLADLIDSINDRVKSAARDARLAALRAAAEAAARRRGEREQAGRLQALACS